MEHSKLNEILERYRAGQATLEDKSFLESWYLEHNQSVPFSMSDEDRMKDVDTALLLIQKKNFPSKKNDVWYRVVAAASILIFLSLSSYFLLHRQHKTTLINVVKYDIAPGKNTATLTLANGKKVVLNDAINGQLANEAGVTVNKTKSGELLYTVQSAQAKNQKLTNFNTLSTANGEQYHVILPDRTQVWLNAATSLKYPVTFNGKERLVELSGEAYFEVAHHKNLPFIVKTKQQEILVLGTHFNVSDYNDDHVTITTLIKGSVKVTAAINHKYVVIKPGQQSILNSARLDVLDADTEEVTAWMNGYFVFNDENLESIMRKISRWYNVDIAYKNNEFRTLVFSGTIPKYKNLSQVIKVLELTNAVHFIIENKKILVTN